MNWDHMNYFHKVAELGSFTLAAKELYITTAALSKAIRNLESEVGFPLFEKQGRVSKLTEYGVMFDEGVTKALRELDKGLQEVYNRVGLVKGHVKIAGVWTMVGGFLPERIKSFSTLHPEVTYHTKYMLTTHVLRNVIDKMADLGLCGDYEINEQDYSQLERILLYKENIVLIAPKDHWAARRKTVDFRELKNEHFVSFQALNAGGVYESFMGLCHKYDIHPKIICEASDDHVIVNFVATGMGLAFIPESKYLPLNNVAVVRFEDDRPMRHQYIVWRKNRYLTPVARAFRDFIISTTVIPNSI